MIKLKVNGAARQFDGDPGMPLLWFLRDELNLKGTKFGSSGIRVVRPIYCDSQSKEAIAFEIKV